MNFNTGLWTGDDGICNKQKWANSCDLTWDGITNNPNACGDENDEDGNDLMAYADDTEDSVSNEGFGAKL